MKFLRQITMEQQYEKMNIQWYPGHMTKARRMMEDSLSLVDAVCEILDARIPRSSRNPELDDLANGKPRLILLNRADLADPIFTAAWKQHFEDQGLSVLETDAKSGKGISSVSPCLKRLLKDKVRTYQEKGQAGRKLRVMIAGIPNVGKSTIINRLAGRNAAVAEDRPGVTRGKQWIVVDDSLELLDTPGILWPKFEDQETGELLAITNAIKSDIVDRETLAANFMLRLATYYPEALEARYKIKLSDEMNGFNLLEEAARKRGFRLSKNEYDLERMANTLLSEYHSGKLGRLTLEQPDE